MAKGSLKPPKCRTILTSVVGVMQALSLLPLVPQKGMWALSGGQLLEMESMGV